MAKTVKDLITLKEYDAEWISALIDKAIKVKKNPQDYAHALDGKSLIMLFQKTSTRTRTSFEVGMTQLGGHAIFLDWRTTQFQMAELEDEGRVLARYGDIIMARLLGHEDVVRLAEASEAPVINGLCERYHPCQAICDMMTIKEKLGGFEGKKLAYVGLGNNVSNSLSLAATRLGMEFVLSSPEVDPPSLDTKLLEEVKATGLYTETTDPKEAVAGADVVYTDTWVNMEFFFDEKFKKEKERRIKTMMPYQVNKGLMDGSSALIMHDMPIHRGYEMDDWAISAPNSIIFDQAENRLHGQKAILLTLMGL